MRLCVFAVVMLACAPKRETPWTYARAGACSLPEVTASHVPPELRACSADGDCVKVATAGCCSQHVGVVRAEHLSCVMPATGGVNCDQLCDRELITPENALALAAVCVNGRCELR